LYGCATTNHGTEPDEQTALEQLATLSLHARLADQAQLNM
jgi:hypothetical protein